MTAGQGAAASPECEVLLDYAASTGESPIWSVAEQCLYWIDIEQPALHRFDPATGSDSHWLLPDEIGCYAVDADGTRAILALRSGVHELQFAGGALRLLAPPPYDPALFRFNDGVCDSTGRFWLGTMFNPRQADPGRPKQQGQCHTYSRAGGLVAQADFAVSPNGLAWSPDYRTLYLAHSEEGIIYAFDCDVAAGRLRGRRVFAVIPRELGVPDGGAVDAAGGYWSAINGGSRLRRFHPDGRQDRDVQLPVSLPTMCAFGGPDLATLYVTSQSGRLSAQQRQHEPLAGRLLCLRPGIRGVATARFGAPAVPS